jgi:hypothetical protein
MQKFGELGLDMLDVTIRSANLISPAAKAFSKPRAIGAVDLKLPITRLIIRQSGTIAAKRAGLGLDTGLWRLANLVLAIGTERTMPWWARSRS